MTKNNSIGVLIVSIGRDYSIKGIFNYLSKIKKPTNTALETLYIVNAAIDAVTWEKTLEVYIKKYGLSNIFQQIQILSGFTKSYKNENNWKIWEKHSRDAFMDKHLSTASNLSIGIDAVKEDLLHIIDDDVIPPRTALSILHNDLINDRKTGMVGGIYFCKDWSRPEINLWRSKKQVARETCISRKNGAPYTLDQLATGNVKYIDYIGNGCILGYTDLFKNTTPLTAEKVTNSWGKGPDFVLCDRVKEQKMKIKISKFVCEHIYDDNKFAGIGTNYIRSIINNKHPRVKIYIGECVSLDLNVLSKRYDIVYKVVKTDQPCNIITKNNINHDNVKIISINFQEHYDKLLSQIPEDNRNIDTDIRIKRLINDNLAYSVLNSHSPYIIHSNLNHTISFKRSLKTFSRGKLTVIYSDILKDFFSIDF